MFSNGIVLLSIFAGLLIFAFDASVTRLIQLYIVGVFTAFTLGQTGMVRHWNAVLRGPLRPEQNGAGSSARGRSTRRCRPDRNGADHRDDHEVHPRCLHRLRRDADPVPAHARQSVVTTTSRRRTGGRRVRPARALRCFPSRVHAIVLVSKIHKPTLRALAYARVGRPDVLEAVTVNVDLEETRALTDEWDRRNLPVPLKVLASPYREITRPIIDYVKSIRRSSPRDIVIVYIPEYIVGRLVGAAPAQPERVAAEGPTAVHTGRDGGQRPLAAQLVRRGVRREENDAPGDVRRGQRGDSPP